MLIPQDCVAGSCECVTVAVQKPPTGATMAGVLTPVELWNFRSDHRCVYFELSAKYASSAVTRLRRSDFIAVMYAFDFVFANFGIAIAAKIPMMTTTIRSSIRVKPLRLRSMSLLEVGVFLRHYSRL